VKQDSMIMRASTVVARFALALGIFGWMFAGAAPADGVIPRPAEIRPHAGTFTAGAGALVRVPARDRGARLAAVYFVDLLTRTYHLRLPIDSGSAADARGATDTIRFRRRPGLGPEAYGLDIEPHRVTVSATTDAGLFYGAVTLWQLVPPRAAAVSIPAQTIHDGPAYRWRGLMLDSVRHFQSPAFIKSMIDWMAWHKLNVLHWHLTDDQGWRLEIKKYPRLTDIGAWRIPAEVPGTVPDTPQLAAASRTYGGYYTQAQVREIVAFAASRHMLIVPEIDVPGHAQAAVAAYPALGVDDRPLAVSARWGVHTHLFNVEPSTFRFLDDVLSEVIALFPGPYVHLGGDEPAKDEWNASAAVQARARALGIPDADALQAYFTQRLEKALAAHHRRLIGWDEILQPGLPRDAIVMSWHGATGAHAAAVSGHDAILAPWPTLYLDYRQSTLPGEPPGRLIVSSLEDVYRFEPRDPTLNADEQAHILGVQANIWTEHMRTEERLQWMALPRAAALAEIAWTAPARRSWPDFLKRLIPMFTRYRAAGLVYADSVFAVDATVTRSADQVGVTLTNQAQRGPTPVSEIHYSLDGSEPTAASAVYREPLSLPLGVELRAAAYVGSELASAVWVRDLDELTLGHKDSHELELCSDGLGLLLEPEAARGAAEPPIAIDIMNPCWIERGVDLTKAVHLRAAVAPLPFNYEIGADADKIRVGDAHSTTGELEIHVDGCDTPAAATLPLQPAAQSRAVTILPALQLAARAGHHDLCFRFARPRLDPMWALDWVEISE
jgi:hexosaminidase